MTNGLSDKTGIPGMTRSRPRYFYCRHSAFSRLLYRTWAWWDRDSTGGGISFLIDASDRSFIYSRI